MIDSYKNVERLRYRLYKDLSEIKYAIDKNTNTWLEEMLVQVSSAVISAMAASVITDKSFSCVHNVFKKLIGKVASESNFFSSWLLTILCFLLMYILVFIVISFLVKIAQYIISRKRITKQADKDYQKEFDNIACDSIFVSFEYKEMYKNNAINSNNLKQFYYFEVLHYLDKTCRVTLDLCRRKDEFIKVPSNASGVELYRIKNLVCLMKEILDFLKQEKNIIVAGAAGNRIDKNVDSIDEMINDINEWIEKL